MAEELNVKIKADSSKLTEELNKVGKTVDSLSKKSSTIQIKTNYAEIVRNLSKLKSNLDKITGTSNISIGLTAGQTLNRLKAIDDRLKSIKKNSNITINVKEKVSQPKRNSASTLSALTQNIGPKATITTYPTATYKTLQQQARNAALQAEKNYNTGDFDSYKNEFMDRMKQLVNFKKALGDISVGQERGIYTNMARSLNSTNPVYGSLIDKIKELNKEQSKLNSLTKDNTNITRSNTSATRNRAQNSNTNTLFNQLKSQALEAGRIYNSADSSNIANAKNNFTQLLNRLIQLKRETGDMSYRKEGSLFSDMAPTLGKNTRAFSLLSDKIKEASANYRMMKAGSTNNSTSGILNEFMTSPNVLRMAGAFERGTGSGIHEIGRQLSAVNSRANGVNTTVAAIAKGLGIVSAIVATVGVGIGAWASIFSTVFGAISEIAGAISSYIIKPAFEATNAMQMMRNGIAGAITSIGLLNEKPVEFATSMQMADNIVKQISVNAIKTGTSLEAISNTFRAILEPGLQNGMNISQIENMASLFTTIGQELQLNSLTIARDTRDIFNGMANRTVMAKQLGITDQEVKDVKARGEDLYAWLENRLQGFVASNRENINTLGGAFNSLKSTWELSLASVFGSENVKQPVIDFINWIRDQIATVYDMKINPNSQLFASEKKAVSAQKGIPEDQVDITDDATKFANDTGATNEEIQSLEDSGATVIKLSDNFKILMNVVADIIVMFANAVDEIANYATAITGSDDATQAFEEILQIAIDFLVSSIKVIMNVCVALYEFYDANRDVISAIGGVAEILAGGFLISLAGVMAPIHALIGALSALYHAAVAVWKALNGDFSGASASMGQATDNILGIAKKTMNDIKSAYSVMGGGFSRIGSAIAGNGQTSDERLAGTLGLKALDLKSAINSVTSKGFITLSTKSQAENQVVGRPAAEDEAAKKKAAKEAIKNSQDMLKEHRAALKEVLDDTLDKLKDELEQNEVAFKEGFKSMQDYYNQKAELERQEAQARLQEAQAEREAINNSLFSSDYEKLKAIHEVDRNIAKYSKALEKSTKTQQAIADTMQSLTTSMDNIGAMVNSEATSGGSPTGTTVNTGINPKTGTLDNITGMSNEEVSYRVMTSQGFSDAIATGIISSLQGESLSNPRDVHFDKNGPSMGIASWHDVNGEGGGRMTDLLNFAKENNSDAYDIRTQLAFLIHEITSGTQVEAFKNALAYFNANGKTAEAMAKAWTIYVERPADAQGEAERRSMNVAGVREILQQANSRPAVQQQAQVPQQTTGVGYLAEAPYSYHGYDTRYMDFSHYLHGENGLDEVKDYVKKQLNLIANMYWEQTGGQKLSINALAGGSHPSNASPYGHSSGYKADLWWETNDSILTPILDKLGVAAGREDEGGNNEHIDVSFASGGVGGRQITANSTGENSYQLGMTPQQINPMITNNAPSTSKEASKAKSDAKDLIEKALKTNVDTYSEVLGVGLKAQLAQLEAEYTRKIDEAKGTPVIAELLKTQKIYKINELMSNYLEKMIDFNLGRMEETISDRAEEIATGKTDASTIIGKYFKYFNQVVDKNSSLAVQNVANQIQDLEGQFANAQRGGQIELAEKIRVKLRATVAKLYSYFDTIISAIDKQFENISNMFATIPMTNLQKEQGEKEIKAYKARAEVNVRQSEEYYGRSNYIALQNTINGLEESQKKLKAGSEEAIKLQGIIAIKNDELIAQKKKLEDNHTALELAKRLAEIPTLLDDIHTTSKQALEDGLVTFLTDGVNEAKNLGEALKNMAVTFLKTMQQMFAKKTVLDLMNKWFEVKDQGGVNKATTGALSTQMDFSHPSYTYTSPVLANSYFGSSNYATASFNNKKPKYGFDNSSLGLSNSPLLATKSIATEAAKNTVKDATKATEVQQATTQIQQLGQTSVQVANEMATGFKAVTASAQASANSLQSLASSTSITPIKKATGGLISGAGTSTSDSIPAMLSNEEYVMKADAVKQYGLNFMDSVNSGHFSGIQVRKFATGGSVSGQASENTAKGMETFGKSIGNSASFTGSYNLILAGNQQEAMEAYMKSPAGQRAMLTFNQKHASVIHRLGN